jgi:hypothetical protein
LRQEEFDFFVSKLAELLAEDIMDAHMVGISPKLEHQLSIYGEVGRTTYDK